MTRWRLLSSVVVVAAIAAACGAPPRAATPADSAVGTPIATVAATTGSDVTSTSASGGSGKDSATTAAEPVLSVALDTAAVDTTAPDIAVATTAAAALPGAATDTTMFPGDVSIDDPLPPQADAGADPAAAGTAVRYAYQHWLLVDLDKHLRARIVENGEANADTMDAKLHELRGTVGCGRLRVDEVRFADADHATVRFVVMCGQGESGLLPGNRSGTAVFVAGTWRISGATLCLLAFGIGTGCSSATDHLPTPVKALHVTPPVGWTWSGDPAFPDIVGVPGGGTWSLPASIPTTPALTDSPGTIAMPSGPPMTLLAVDAEVLAGVSSLSADDAQTVLASGRYTGPDSTPIVIGDLPARASTNMVALIRHDDVVVWVSAAATPLSRDALVAMARSITPSDVVPPATTIPMLSDGGPGLTVNVPMMTSPTTAPPSAAGG